MSNQDVSKDSKDLPLERRKELAWMATRQKEVLICIILNLMIVVAIGFLLPQGILPPSVLKYVLWFMAVVGMAQLVLVAMLANKLFSKPVGIFMIVWLVLAALSNLRAIFFEPVVANGFSQLVLGLLLPLLALLVLLIVNGATTRMLKKHGVRVGLFGAKMSDI